MSSPSSSTPTSAENNETPASTPKLPPKVPFSSETNLPAVSSLSMVSSASGGGLPPLGHARRVSTPNAIISSTNSNNSRPRRASLGSSQEARQGLQRSISERQMLLTDSETKFLQDLVVHGTDQEIEIAHGNLLNEATFGKNLALATANAARVADAWVAGGPPAMDKSSHSHTQAPHTHSSSFATGSIAGSSLYMDADSIASVGSERRNQVLQQRLDHIHVFDQIWQAHATGIAVTHSASRRSIRNNSWRFANKSKQRSHSAIFRKTETPQQSSRSPLRLPKPHQRSNSVLQGPVVAQQLTAGGIMNDNKSDNNRRRPVVPLLPKEETIGTAPSDEDGDRKLPPTGVRRSSLRRFTSTSDIDTEQQQHRRSLSTSASKPVLKRMMSDSSRKSVTFGNVPPRHARSASLSMKSPVAFTRNTSFGSIPSLHRAHPLRSNSIASMSSGMSLNLHRAHPIRSFSMASNASGMSFPALPHARAMRSTSIMSTGSNSVVSSSQNHPQLLYHFEGRDPSEGGDEYRREEKKIDDLWPHVPAVVQTNDTTKYFAQRGAARTDQVDPLANDGTVSSEYFHLEEGGDSQSLTEHEASQHHKGEIFVTMDPTESSEGYHRPVLMRDVSAGEGVEVADMSGELFGSPVDPSEVVDAPAYYVGDDDSAYVETANSFDETMSYGRMSTIFRRPIQRSLSDEAAAGLFTGPTNYLRDVSSSVKEIVPSDGDSWQMDDDDDDLLDYYDPWMVIQDEYENGYGGGGTLPFQIIGTSGDDRRCQPHVLSPPLMESLQQFFPFNKTGENFWLKYSLVRDGADMHTFLKNARNAKSSILAIETTDGEVFGAFTSECWRKNWNFFGSNESFLWRMRQSRGEKARSIIDQASRESELDVFPYTGENSSIQLCTGNRLAVGGGAGGFDDVPDENPDDELDVKDHDWGHGLAIQGDLLQGISSPCMTFGSPSLSTLHADGSRFEIMNLELWALTPCYSLEEAEKLELGKLFLEK